MLYLGGNLGAVASGQPARSGLGGFGGGVALDPADSVPPARTCCPPRPLGPIVANTTRINSRDTTGRRACPEQLTLMVLSACTCDACALRAHRIGEFFPSLELRPFPSRDLPCPFSRLKNYFVFSNHPPSFPHTGDGTNRKSCARSRTSFAAITGLTTHDGGEPPGQPARAALQAARSPG